MNSNDPSGAGRLLEIAERDIGRIILDIHDGPVQNVFAALSQLDVARRQIEAYAPDAEDALVRIRRSMALLEQALTDIRTFIGAFRPPEFERRDLVAILEGLVMQHEELSGNAVQLRVHGEAPIVALPVKIALYRILQEALSNGVRHGRATQQRVTLNTDPTGLTLEVDDNGCGFDVETVLREPLQAHFGLQGMRERVHALGGSLAIQSAPGQGAQVRVRIAWR